MLGADVVVTKLQGLTQCQLQNLLGARGERRLAARPLLAVPDDAFDLLAHLVEGHVQRRKRPGRHPFVLPKEAEQQVLGADVVVVEGPGLFLSQDHDLAGPFGKSFEH